MNKERPILFSGPMVRAILDGHKTQTRRVVNPQPCEAGFAAQPFNWSRVEKIGSLFHIISEEPSAQFTVRCPYGAPGDRLWVKETWAVNPEGHPGEAGFIYRATDPAWDDEGTGLKWTPSIYMPRWASRITLEIVSVRVERVQDIRWDDVLAEGFPENYNEYNRGAWFKEVWDSINAKRGHGWDANPWVWAIEFKRIQP